MTNTIELEDAIKGIKLSLGGMNPLDYKKSLGFAVLRTKKISALHTPFFVSKIIFTYIYSTEVVVLNREDIKEIIEMYFDEKEKREKPKEKSYFMIFLMGVVEIYFIWQMAIFLNHF